MRRLGQQMCRFCLHLLALLCWSGQTFLRPYRDQTYSLNQKFLTLLPDKIHMLCMCHATMSPLTNDSSSQAHLA